MDNGERLVDPAEHLPWLLSRAFGLAAMLFLSLAVAWGLSFSSRFAKTGPGSLVRSKQVHEGLSLAALLFIFLHGAVLLWDKYIDPSVLEIIIPFTMTGQPVWTGIGILAAWIAFPAGLVYYARNHLRKSWKIIHRFTLLAWILALIHTIGSGSDSSNILFPVYLALLILPVLFAVIYRLLPKDRA